MTLWEYRMVMVLTLFMVVMVTIGTCIGEEQSPSGRGEPTVKQAELYPNLRRSLNGQR